MGILPISHGSFVPFGDCKILEFPQKKLVVFPIYEDPFNLYT